MIEIIKRRPLDPSGVPTKRLNEQVRRNTDRFPPDFAFVLTDQEVTNLKSQFATSSEGLNRSQFVITSTHGGRRKLPMAFTEHGAIMAANVLRSKRAIHPVRDYKLCTMFM